MTEKMQDQAYLKTKQYANPNNLNARITVHSYFSTGTESWNDFIYRYLKSQPGLKMLALGCGNATQWRSNALRFSSNVQIVLSDLSMGMLKEGRETFKEDARYGFLCLDAQLIPFDKDSFDRVTANHMLYHVPHIDRALQEASRVLRTDGLFMAATNGEAHMHELYRLLRQFEPNYQVEDEKHTRFSLENGALQLEEFFKYVDVRIYNSDLWVTDAGLLVDYVYSMWDANETISQARREEMCAYFQTLIERDGGIFIRKSTGVFLASQNAESLASV